MRNLIIESDDFISEITPNGHFTVKSKKDDYKSYGEIYKDAAGQLIVYDENIESGAPINGEDASTIEKYLTDTGFFEDDCRHDFEDDEDEYDFEDDEYLEEEDY